MDTGTAAITGALIGALSATLGTLLNSWFQVRMERVRWPKQREDALADQYRQIVQGLTTNMASALHSICWLTWPASRQSVAITPERVGAYDAELHKLLPQITGSLATVAVLDPLTYDKFQELAEHLYALDSRVGEACLHLDEHREKSIRALAACWKDAVEMDKQLPREVAGIVQMRLDLRAKNILADLS